MPLFVALIKGTGEGCDYTYDCNKTWRVKEADNISEFRNMILEDFGMLNFNRDHFPDILIEEMEIYEVNGSYQKVTGIPEWFEKEMEKYKANKNEEAERALYEELRKKYE